MHQRNETKRKKVPRPWEIFPVLDLEKPSGPKQMFLALAVMCLLIFVVSLFQVPNPNILMITGLVAFTSLYGYGAGAVCAAVTIAYSLYFFSIDHSFLAYTRINLQKLVTVALGVMLNVLFIGRLKKIQREDRNQLLKANMILRDDNLSLEQASAIDDLTGTRNRFAFRRDYLKYEDRNVHVMMFDLDDFKRTNDTLGHAIGDYVLEKVGDALKEAFGPAYCYRYGGDEFLVVCPDTPEELFARKVAEVREKMHRLSVEGRSLPVRFSAGYVYGWAERSADLRLMLRHADYMLYRAKEHGKDQSCACTYSRTFAERLEKEPEENFVRKNVGLA